MNTHKQVPLPRWPVVFAKLSSSISIITGMAVIFAWVFFLWIPEEYRYKLFRGRSTEETKKEFINYMLKLDYLFGSPNTKDLSTVKLKDHTLDEDFLIIDANLITSKYGERYVLVLENKESERAKAYLPKMYNDHVRIWFLRES